VHQIANPLNLLDVFGGRTDYQFNKNNRLGAKSDRLLAILIGQTIQPFSKFVNLSPELADLVTRGR
jgi:hypothetical protein